MAESFPNLRQMARHGKFYGFESSQKELRVSLALVDVLGALIEDGEIVPVARGGKFFAHVKGEDLGLEFDITEEQYNAINSYQRKEL